ncbi:MAG: peptide deformylase [Bacteroidales bacterium]|jgi:peptide deformylase|nr:peptide deformylase [Bacteroidales bacterium]
MIYPITLFGAPILRKVAEPVNMPVGELQEFAANMFETMNKAEGVGLAAPQVGRSWRVFVIDTAEVADQYKEEPDLKYFRRVFVNPEILEHSSETCVSNEGCLSIPDIHEDVTRPKSIKIKYMDENLQEHIEDLTGFKARVVQHEYDHLEGKLHVDYLNILKKKLLKSKLSAMARGKVKTKYMVAAPGK